jgi:hypothetical protein
MYLSLLTVSIYWSGMRLDCGDGLRQINSTGIDGLAKHRPIDSELLELEKVIDRRNAASYKDTTGSVV